MRNFLVVIVIAISLIWTSSFFFKPVQNVLQQPPAIEKLEPVVKTKAESTATKTEKKAHVYVQHASFRTLKDARNFQKSIEKKYGKTEIRKVTVKSGTWYRVLSVQSSLDAAKAKCTAIKASGKDCLVLTY